MYKRTRHMIEKQYGSINRLAKALQISPCDMYCAFAGTKPMYPKYKRLIAEALGEDESTLFTEAEK